jgi:hypothetical protein
MIQNEILLPIRFHPILHERSAVTPNPGPAASGPANGQGLANGLYYSILKSSQVVCKLCICPEISSFLMTVYYQADSEGE